MQPGGMTLCKAESAASARQKNYVRGAAIPLRFPSLTSLFIWIILFKCTVLHPIVKMSKPFNPEEAENLEDVRPRAPTHLLIADR
jgi:hypothetical protein